ncbi:MAG: hypothetical protein JJW01_00965 [Alphaproteobacteria bacterium]|nr:hypothetical protein [Rickettsiales bacterium]
MKNVISKFLIIGITLFSVSNKSYASVCEMYSCENEVNSRKTFIIAVGVGYINICREKFHINVDSYKIVNTITNVFSELQRERACKKWKEECIKACPNGNEKMKVPKSFGKVPEGEYICDELFNNILVKGL